MPSWWLYLFYFTIVFAVIYLLYYNIFKMGPSSSEEYMREMNPNWTESTTKPEKYYTYHSPYYSSQVELTPRLRKVFRDYVGPDVPFERLIAEAILKGTAEDREKLKTTYPEIWEKMKAGGITAAPTATTAVEEAAVPVGISALTDETSLAKGKEIFAKNCVACHGPNAEGLIGPNLTDQYWINGGRFEDIIHVINVGVPAKGMIPWEKTLTADQIQQVASYIVSLQGSNPPNAKAPEGDLYQ
ncbi:MAG: c-type cytochrome, partial [FCB group bacterium]|nr:c-type cytochrome [FCB group bacterium]